MPVNRKYVVGEAVSVAVFYLASSLVTLGLTKVGLTLPPGFSYSCPPLMKEFLAKGYTPNLSFRFVQCLHGSISPAMLAVSIPVHTLVIILMDKIVPELLTLKVVEVKDGFPVQGAVFAEGLMMLYFIMVCQIVPAFLARRGKPKILWMPFVMPMMVVGKSTTGPGMSPAHAIAARIAHPELAKGLGGVAFVYVVAPLIGAAAAAIIISETLGQRFPTKLELPDPKTASEKDKDK